MDDFIGIRRALPVSWYAQMVNANCVIDDAKTETSCPAQTMVNAVMPVGYLDDGVLSFFLFQIFQPALAGVDFFEANGCVNR